MNDASLGGIYRVHGHDARNGICMWEQAATAHQMMDRLGRQLEVGHGRNPNSPGMDQ